MCFDKYSVNGTPKKLLAATSRRGVILINSGAVPCSTSLAVTVRVNDALHIELKSHRSSVIALNGRLIEKQHQLYSELTVVRHCYDLLYCALISD
ncbi:hypothetical protein J6590_019887 [Homalodisca vitripennis]|nr:hypothetical protein J6590_019887 [Homalodisca vitripennis]